MVDISVVIPVYNSERTIVQCLDSVIENLKDSPYIWEIVVVDDGSIDRSVEIIHDYVDGSSCGHNIELIEQPNGGAASARNTGINASSGRYIAFNDSDDCWIPGKIDLQMQYLLDNPTVDMLCGAHEAPYKPIFKKLDEYTRITVKDIIFQNFCSPPTTIIKRNILQRTGLFDENMRFGAEEGSLFLSLAYYGHCVLYNKVVSKSVVGKQKWGESGLSGNLWRMEKGKQYNFRQAYRRGFISCGNLVLCSVYSYMKYVRRLIIKIFRSL